MAKKRMFSVQIVGSDAFQEMSIGARLLYYELGMVADDDGFVSSPSVVLRSCRCNSNDLRRLLDEGYIFRFPSGVLLIRHWFLHNTIKPDRYHPTMHTAELSQVEKDRFKVYQMKKRGSPDNDTR